MTDDELDRIREHYARRASAPTDRYHISRPDVFRSMQAVDRATMALLMKRARMSDIANLRLLEVGCGTGGNLLRFLRWGFDPANVVGNEFLEDRFIRARRMLPPAVELRPGDARALSGEPFDIVYQSTVLSSILDDSVQRQVAQRMWALTRPGGIVLSYDFTVNNPKNPDVRGVPKSRLRELFPEGDITTRRVTLAPPLARRVAFSRTIHALLEAVPLLRTHLIAVAKRPL